VKDFYTLTILFSIKLRGKSSLFLAFRISIDLTLGSGYGKTLSREGSLFFEVYFEEVGSRADLNNRFFIDNFDLS